MRLLAIDVGNTSTAVGIWREGSVGNVAHIDGDVKEAAVRIHSILHRVKVEAVAYASVVPKKDAEFRSLFKSLGLRMIAVGSGSFDVFRESIGMGLDYPNPSEIGADRFSDAAGAFSKYGAPVMIMDFGTALTAAIITGDHVWRGGVIAPGFPLMRDYLFERTAKLPRMEMGGKLPRIGRSTEEAMRFGAMVGYRGMVREIVSELRNNFGEDFRLVATGGFAKWALKGIDMDFVIDPNLTLYGTGLICAKNL